MGQVCQFKPPPDKPLAVKLWEEWFYCYLRCWRLTAEAFLRHRQW